MDIKKMTVPTLLVLGGVLQVASIATNSWSTTKSVDNSEASIGLWKDCGSVGSQKTNCKDISVDSTAKNALMAVRGLMISSVLLLVVAGVLIMYQPHLKMVIGGSMGLSFLLGVVAAYLWNQNKTLHPTGSKHGYSFILNIVGYFITLFALIFYVSEEYKEKPEVSSRFGFKFY